MKQGGLGGSKKKERWHAVLLSRELMERKPNVLRRM
jgi:hypothetical protein